MFRSDSLNLPLAVAALLCAGTALHAGLAIDATFDPSLDSAEIAAINQAISTLTSDITSPNNLTVSIYFNSMSSGLGESSTTIYEPTYLQYYDAYAAVATSPDQLEALHSLGTAPTGSSSDSPVPGTDNEMWITAAECRNLDITALGSCAGGVDKHDPSGLVPSTQNGTFDGAIGLNTSFTSPGNGDYSLEAVAAHEIDEVLGIGGTGSTIGDGSPFSGHAGDLDLFRFTAPGVRSYSTMQTTSPYSYFSIDGGQTVLSYFNQTQGADYADWLSNCASATLCTNDIPNGFPVQVQDAFGTAGASPVLGQNEIIAFNVIGYEIAPEPSSIALTALGLALGLAFLRRGRTYIG